MGGNCISADHCLTPIHPPPLQRNRSCIVRGGGAREPSLSFCKFTQKVGYQISPVRLRLLRCLRLFVCLRLPAGQGGIIGALLCTADFLHPRHSTVPCIMQNISVFRNFSH